MIYALSLRQGLLEADVPAADANWVLPSFLDAGIVTPVQDASTLRTFVTRVDSSLRCCIGPLNLVDPQLCTLLGRVRLAVRRARLETGSDLQARERLSSAGYGLSCGIGVSDVA